MDSSAQFKPIQRAIISYQIDGEEAEHKALLLSTGFKVDSLLSAIHAHLMALAKSIHVHAASLDSFL